jgi:hypothetical protein
MNLLASLQANPGSIACMFASFVMTFALVGGFVR